MANSLNSFSTALADRYTLGRELGRGGTATVYLAQDRKHPRLVAVKVLRPELASTIGPDRFSQEIAIAARLQHPHILPLLDSGEAGGCPYYVMPYVDGEMLRARLVRKRKLAISESVRILRDIVDALAYAHEHHVVHRDVKPENVMLSARHALVMDFGVARAIGAANLSSALTTGAMALGTPTYMAPEQAVADRHIDGRADIYAVGAMAYEMLTGRPPFQAPTLNALLSAHITRDPEPVSRHRAAVPLAFQELIMRCLAKDPGDRWQRTEELLCQIESLITPSSGITPVDATTYRGSSRAPPHHIALALIGSALIGLSALVGVVLGQHVTARTAAGTRTLGDS